MHGVCLAQSDQPQGHRCFCENGYTGHHCQVNYDECSLQLCQNNATCEDLVGTFRCHCLPGYTGKPGHQTMNAFGDMATGNLHS